MKIHQRTKTVSPAHAVTEEMCQLDELKRKFNNHEISLEQYMEGKVTGKSVVAERQTPLFDGTPEPRALTESATALKFILAGNAYFTLRSKATGTRYTYRVSKGRAHAGKCKYCLNDPCHCQPRYFVALLTGPENTSDYSYLGMIVNNQFRLTRASKMQQSSKPIVAFVFMLTMLTLNQRVPTTLEIWHEGRCGRCGRTLTVPESIAMGLGPECAGRV